MKIIISTFLLLGSICLSADSLVTEQERSMCQYWAASASQAAEKRDGGMPIEDLVDAIMSFPATVMPDNVKMLTRSAAQWIYYHSNIAQEDSYKEGYEMCIDYHANDRDTF